MINGLYLVATGRLPENSGKRFGPRAVRALGACVALVGIVFALSSFVLNAEPPGGFDSHWGRRGDWILTAVWLAFLGGIVAYGVRRTVREERQRRTRRRRAV